ncbi:DUF1700 domain-containing protein [Porcipelethomonas sp.]|uniref:DUF1700 domain-containing protein n=1 Tax=Porcipelethomonas sp. TaxID=2981675 RepID=UPI003EF99505
MTKYDYLSKLNHYLQPLPPKERNAAIKYYDKYFIDAGIENEYNVIASLGSPKVLAEKILNNRHGFSGMINETKSNVSKANKKMTSSQRRFLLLMAVVLFPVWGGILLLIMLAVLGLFAAAAMFLAGLFIGGIAVFCMGIPYLFDTLSIGLFLVGTGIAMSSLTFIIFNPVIKFVAFIFKSIVKGIILLINKMVGRKAVKI